MISDVAEDSIKVQLDRNIFESAESLTARLVQLRQEAQRGCDLYDRGHAVEISHRCVKFTDSGRCDVEEYLFA